MKADNMIMRTGICVRLDVSMWSARAKLRKEDIPDADKLPPEELASLGSKRLFDTDGLKVFNMLKMRAWTLLDHSGVRLMGGWLVSKDKVDELNDKLWDIKADFDAAVHNFLQTYDDGVRNWLEQFPQWSGILVAAMPSHLEVSRKYSFQWQMYNISPVEGSSSNIGELAEGLADNALGEVRKIASDIFRDNFQNNNKVSKRTLRSLNPLCEKLRGVAFIHPQLQELADLAEVLQSTMLDDPDMEKNKAAVCSFLCSLQNDDFMRLYLTPWSEGQTTTGSLIDTLAGLTGAPQAGTVEVPVNAVAVKVGDFTQNPPVETIQIVPTVEYPPKTAPMAAAAVGGLESMGLW